MASQTEPSKVSRNARRSEGLPNKPAGSKLNSNVDTAKDAKVPDASQKADGVLTVFLETTGHNSRVVRFCEVVTPCLIIRIRPRRTIGLFDVFNSDFAGALGRTLSLRRVGDFFLRRSHFPYDSPGVTLGQLTALHNSRKVSDHEIVTLEVLNGSAAALFAPSILSGYEGDVLEFREREDEDAPFVDRPQEARLRGFQTVQSYLSQSNPTQCPPSEEIDAAVRDFEHLISRPTRLLN